MTWKEPSMVQRGGRCPRVLPVREQDAVIRRVLEQRLEAILPAAMRENGFDMWIILCQEDDFDPIFETMMPMNTWCPILQILVFYDRGEGAEIERINLSMTKTRGLFDEPWSGQRFEEQWALLHSIVEERDPQHIGINIGSVQWAAGGLTHNLYRQLVAALPEMYVSRLESAEPMCTRWAATLSDAELGLYQHVADVAHHLIAKCYSRETIVPGLTTTTDLEWAYWQYAADLGLQPSFKPFFNIVRSPAMKQVFAQDDSVIRPGDLIHCDVGISYLRLISDNQEWCYVLQPGEEDAPLGARRLMDQVHRLQDIFMDEFKPGLTGNEMLANILARARREGVPNPKVYSHSLGLFLHEPGPLIGLPWEQKNCDGRGDVRLTANNAFTMELRAADAIPEWGPEMVSLSLEEDVVFTNEGCRLIDGRQTEFFLV
ncbi:MAG: M24 family metallopeptidase [Anaerolineae bacterium]|nr:M24 family metallopeptidase [Anaerolineae bacterium]